MSFVFRYRERFAIGLSLIIHSLVFSIFYFKLPEIEKPKNLEIEIENFSFSKEQVVQEKVAPKITKQVEKKQFQKVIEREPVPVKSLKSQEVKKDKQIETLDREKEEQAKISYFDLVVLKLAEKKVYPKVARRLGVEGNGVLSFSIDKSGNVKNSRISQSTKSQILDDEIIEMLKKAEPFPAFPEYILDSSLSFDVPISFKLD